MTTFVKYVGDGSTTDFSYSFSHLADSYVAFKVTDIDLTDVTSNYTGTYLDASTYRITPAPDNNYSVEIYRDTQLSDETFSFATGSVIRPSDLKDAFEVIRDYAEEKSDQVTNASLLGQIEAVNAATSRAGNLEASAEAHRDAAAASATDAAISATSASGNRTLAQTAVTDAETAKAGAETAQTAAETARDTAETYRDGAQVAKAAAEAALAALNNKFHGAFADDAACEAAIAADADLTLEAGDLFFNSTDNLLRYYDGSAWYNAANTNVIDISTLGSVPDVSIPSVSENDILVRGTSAWEAKTLTELFAALGLAQFTQAMSDKLATVEAGATGDLTGAEIKSLYEAEPDTQALTDNLYNKLAAIEENADVTDADNVAAAGAVMTSGLANASAVNTLDQDVSTTATDVVFNTLKPTLTESLTGNSQAGQLVSLGANSTFTATAGHVGSIVSVANRSSSDITITLTGSGFTYRATSDGELKTSIIIPAYGIAVLTTVTSSLVLVSGNAE